MRQQTLFDGVGLDPDDVPVGATLSDARPYQLDWSQAVFASWRANQRCVGVAATGTGKTFLAGLIGRRVLDGELDPVCPARARGLLMIAHRIDLVRQTAAEVGRLIPSIEVEVEQGDDRSSSSPIVAACLDSLKGRRLEYLVQDRFHAVLWDECHRFGKGNRARKRVMDAMGPEVRHVGITATPREGTAEAFGRPAFDYGIWRAVDDGYLVKPYLAYEISGDVTVDGVPLTADGDFDGKALGRRMSEAPALAAVVKAAIKWSNYANGRAGARSTVVCCSSVEHAKLVAIQLNEWHKTNATGRAGAVYGAQEPGDREAVMQAFRRGELRYVTHFDCLSEGFDFDEVKVLVNGRPTKSQWVFAQNAGRALRPLRDIARQLGRLPTAADRRAAIAGSAKPAAVIVDVAGVDHKLTVDLASIFHAPGDDDLVEKVRVKARSEKNGKPFDPTVDFAELRRKREEERAALWKGVRVDTTFITRMVNPFDVLAVVTGREPGRLRGKRPTDKMKGYLERAGIPKHDVDAMTWWKAKKMADVVSKRRDDGLCSYKQCRLLMEYGYDGTCMTREEASAMIDRIAADGWRKTG